MNILHIDASASDANLSHTRRLSAEFVRKLTTNNAQASVVYRDVVVDPLPHVDLTILQAWSPDIEKDASLLTTAARSKAVVDEIRAADVVVIGSPMYNFTVPSTLKSWIDHVSIAGQTFQYTENGSQGLLRGKAYLVLSCGGIYTIGPSRASDHLSTYLTTALNLMGVEVVGVVFAEGTAYGPEADKAAMSSAREQIETLLSGQP